MRTLNTNQDTELGLSPERMELALKATGAVLWEWQPGNGISMLAGEQLFGRDLESLDEVLEMVYADDRQQVEDARETVLETAETVAVEYRVQVDDEVRWLESRGKAITDDSGEQETRIHGVSHDITDLKTREQQLERQNAQLNEFTSIVSHDLRSPLTVAEGRIELAREDCESDHLVSAAAAVNRSLELVQDLLTLTRTGGDVQQMESTPLAEVAEACWGNVETGDATLAVDTEQVLQGAPNRIKQLLENLMRNAVDHGEGGVTVTIGDLEDGFYVADDGPGIPTDNQEKVLEEGYSTADDGTGFGLNIVQGVASEHGWEMQITNSESGGARFEFTNIELEA